MIISYVINRSTRVQVAELASTSQLPSPHGHCTSFLQLNSADLIKSVNKKVRETYIRSRICRAYSAIERLSQSEFNLDQLASVATTSIQINEIPITCSGQSIPMTGSGPGPTELIVPGIAYI